MERVNEGRFFFLFLLTFFCFVLSSASAPIRYQSSCFFFLSFVSLTLFFFDFPSDFSVPLRLFCSSLLLSSPLMTLLNWCRAVLYLSCLFSHRLLLHPHLQFLKILNTPLLFYMKRLSFHTVSQFNGLCHLSRIDGTFLFNKVTNSKYFCIELSASENLEL